MNQRLYPDFQRNARGMAPSLGYSFGHYVRLNWGYTLEWVEINQKNAIYHSVLYNLEREGRVSAFNASVSFDSRNNRLFPTQGFFSELRTDVSSPYFGASPLMTFERFEWDARYFQAVLWSIVFRSNIQVGYVLGGPMGLPVSERYFPGGIYSVRGFQPRALGPTIRLAADHHDPRISTRDFVIGGNKQFILNLELEYPILPQAGLKAVIFADAGNAYHDDENFFYIGTPFARRAPGWLIGSNAMIQVPLGLFYSVGFGIRWQSPIGPLRFEWGIPITKHDPLDQPIIFEFTIGNFF
jgi:outer membrane protein insertion porin family